MLKNLSQVHQWPKWPVNQRYVQLHPCINTLEISWQLGLRSFIIPGLPAHLVQELNVGTVGVQYEKQYISIVAPACNWGLKTSDKTKFITFWLLKFENKNHTNVQLKQPIYCKRISIHDPLCFTCFRILVNIHLHTHIYIFS